MSNNEINEEQNNSSPDKDSHKQNEPVAGHNNKKQYKKNNQKKSLRKHSGINFGIGTLMLIIFCAFLLVIATFLQLDVTHLIIPTKLFSGETLEFNDFLYTIKYIPQIPVALFIFGLLGRRYGSLSIILYIMIGLFCLPIFALGGGLRYILTYGFGYIVAYLPAGIILGSVLKKDYSYQNIAKAVFFGVLTIHVIGIIYMIVLANFNHTGIGFVTDWLISQSGIKILYDFIFSFLIILIAKYARIILWFYL